MTSTATWLLAAAALGSALLVLLLRQPMRAALALIAHMISLAALFAVLGVHVIALFQVLIYVGAVMVLMVYTIMLLDERDSAYAQRFSHWSIPALGVAVALIVALRPLAKIAATQPAAPGSAPFDFAGFATAFMTRYWLHFELATVLLLAGLIAAWAVLKERPR